MKVTMVIGSALVALVLLITPADSISCYVCKETDTGCGMSFNYVTSVMSIKTDCNYCTKSFYNLAGTNHVSRDCTSESLMKDSCVDATVMGFGGTQCACSSSLCNGSGIARSSLGLLAAMVLILVFSIFRY